MAAAEPWFVAERAEALAVVYLTRRHDIDVIPVSSAASHPGYDLLVQLRQGDAATRPSFGVVVKGARSPRRATGGTRPASFPVAYTAREFAPNTIPICIFLFTVDDELGFYRWLQQPYVTPQGQAILRYNLPTTDQRLEQPDRIILNTAVAPLDNQVIEQLIAQVVQWYEARRRASA
ncbi:MAG: hypothetical protein ACTHMU_08560 [Thermomicrobiales bacterium]